MVKCQTFLPLFQVGTLSPAENQSNCFRFNGLSGESRVFVGPWNTPEAAASRATHARCTFDTTTMALLLHCGQELGRERHLAVWITTTFNVHSVGGEIKSGLSLQSISKFIY